MTHVTSNPDDPTTAASTIERLMKQGVFDNKTLMEKSGANSLGYVRKVKSKVMKKMRLPSSNPGLESSTSPSDEAEKSMLAQPGSHTSYDLDLEDRKKLWSEFIAGTPLPEIIVKYGIPYPIVLAEFDGFQVMNGVSVTTVQGVILEKLGSRMNELTGYLSKDNFKRYSEIVSEFRSKRFGLRFHAPLPEYAFSATV